MTPISGQVVIDQYGTTLWDHSPCCKAINGSPGDAFKLTLFW